MEKDVDEVGKIAHKIKNRLQDIDRDVLFFKKLLMQIALCHLSYKHHLKRL